MTGDPGAPRISLACSRRPAFARPRRSAACLRQGQLIALALRQRGGVVGLGGDGFLAAASPAAPGSASRDSAP